MRYNVTVCVIDPKTCKARRETLILSTDILSPTYEDMVIEYFRQWDKEDKYREIYPIGIEQMELIDVN